MRISDWSSDVCSSDLSADRIFALETDLATHHWSREDSRDAVKTYNLRSWDDTVALSGIDLAPWRDGVSPGYPDAFAEVVVYQPSFLERSEEHTSELQSLVRISYADFCLKKKTKY